MSIQSEIDRIITAVGNAYSKVSEKGGTVPASQTVANLATAIDSIPAGCDIISRVLDENSWDAIKLVSSLGKGANYWAVGDCKQITMNGKVSDGLTLTNYTAWVYIIGFNHNAEREGNGITFQGFKATNNGTSVCLTDSGYESPQSSGTWFNMIKNDSSSSTSNSKGIVIPPPGSQDAKGWQSCGIRTAVMPLIKAAFPADLQAVIKPSTIFTAPDTGNIALTSTVDEVFLLAEYEVFGTERYWATTEEPNYLKQYAYYSAGNSKVKYKHNDANTTAIWWLRSRAVNAINSFCVVYTDGRSAGVGALPSFGVSPAFKV